MPLPEMAFWAGWALVVLVALVAGLSVERVGGAQDRPEVELRRVADVGQHRGGVLHAGDRHRDLVVARRAHLRAGHAEPVDPVVEDVHRLLQLGLRDGLRGLVDDGQATRQVETELGGPFGREDGGKRTQAR